MPKDVWPVPDTPTDTSLLRIEMYWYYPVVDNQVPELLRCYLEPSSAAAAAQLPF